MRIGTHFLKDEPSTWHQHVQYQDGLVKINALEVVNAPFSQNYIPNF